MPWLEHLSSVSRHRAASAPYNFVPLPDAVVPAPHQAPAFHDTYQVAGHPHTGYFDVVLTTLSPLYVRGPLTVSQFEQAQHQSNTLPFRAQLKNKPDFFHTGDRDQPVIPGSSLRGMLRSLLEIASYSKMDRVADQDKIYFRALFEPEFADDPLVVAYQDRLGKLGKRVEAGYLRNVGGRWHARRAATLPSSTSKGPHVKPGIKIKEADISPADLPDLIRFDDPDYAPQSHLVSFDAVVDSLWVERIRKEIRFWRITRIGTRTAGYPFKGVLICSGNMLETNDGSTPSPRSSHIVVLDEGPNKLIEIDDQAVADYKHSLTKFQRDHFDERDGCLKEGAPIFFTVDDDNIIRNFGHSPFFRIAALDNAGHALSSCDLIPPSISGKSAVVDYSDAIFGTIGGVNEFGPCAGRVSVGDAKPIDKPADLWLSNQMEYQIIEPQILASPKPTAFQHYLVQKSDNRGELRHYDTSSGATTLRGHKLYWHQGDRSAYYIQEHREKHVNAETERVRESSTQHTQVRPVRSGVRFRFRVYFENLSDAELGALCWTLHPQGDPDVHQDPRRGYHHKLGMGKPLGMGSVRLEATLCLTDRTAPDARNRYRRLFDSDAWHTGLHRDSQGHPTIPLDPYVTRFEQHVLGHLQSVKAAPETATRLWDLGRIQALLKMMEWPGFPARESEGVYLNQEQRPNTRYMTTEEYAKRRVLPHPLAFPVPDPADAAPQPPPPEVRWPTAAPLDGPAADPTVAPGTTQQVPSTPQAVRFSGRGRILSYEPATRKGMIQPESGGSPVPFHLGDVKHWQRTGLPSAGRSVHFSAETTAEGPQATSVEMT